MPKTNLCKPTQNPFEAELRGMITGGMGRADLSMKDLAKKANIPYSTLNKRLNEDPGSLTMKELWAICRVIKPRAYEKVRIV